jgi:hypothetical protein
LRAAGTLSKANSMNTQPVQAHPVVLRAAAIRAADAICALGFDAIVMQIGFFPAVVVTVPNGDARLRWNDSLINVAPICPQHSPHRVPLRYPAGFDFAPGLLGAVQLTWSVRDEASVLLFVHCFEAVRTGLVVGPSAFSRSQQAEIIEAAKAVPLA